MAILLVVGVLPLAAPTHAAPSDCVSNPGDCDSAIVLAGCQYWQSGTGFGFFHIGFDDKENPTDDDNSATGEWADGCGGNYHDDWVKGEFFDTQSGEPLGSFYAAEFPKSDGYCEYRFYGHDVEISSGVVDVDPNQSGTGGANVRFMCGATDNNDRENPDILFYGGMDLVQDCNEGGQSPWSGLTC